MFDLIKGIFSVKSIDSVVDAVIATGDKLVYTNEEKAEMKQKVGELHIKMLGAYEPFKIAQRFITFSFMFLYSLAFLIGLVIVVFNSIHKYIELSNGVEVKNIIEISLEPLFNLVLTFNVGIIIGTIVVFYFGGGTINSIRGK